MLRPKIKKYLDKLGPEKIKPGLKRIKLLLKWLGNPQQKLRAIHISGTNGKGSTLAFLASILTEAGYQVGTFTSPHLIKVNERIGINLKPIPDCDLEKLLIRIKPLAKRIEKETTFGHPTYFEVLTAAAFEYFSWKKLDFSLIEVGIEGKFDATNVINPIISIITSADLDHQEYLGSTLNSVIKEMASVIKPGFPLVTAVKNPQALNFIKKKAKNKGALLFQVGKDVTWEEVSFNLKKQVFHYNGLFNNWKNLEISLLGEFQLSNACCALATVELLIEQGWEIKESSIRRGLKKACWPGRLQIIKEKPLFIVDGAHNPEAAQILKKAIYRHFPSRKIIFILSILKDKDVEGILKILAPIASLVIATEVDSPRATKLNDLYEMVLSYNNQVLKAKKINEAIQLAFLKAGFNSLICATGSLLTVGETLSQIENLKRKIGKDNIKKLAKR